MEPFALLRLEPALHLGAFVGALVIHDQMHVLLRRQLLLQLVQEPDKFPAAVTFLTSADDFAIEDVEGGEQRGGSVTLAVVGLVRSFLADLRLCSLGNNDDDLARSAGSMSVGPSQTPTGTAPKRLLVPFMGEKDITPFETANRICS